MNGSEDRRTAEVLASGAPETSLASGRHRRAGLSAFAAFVAVSAYGGALALATGVLELGTTIDHRLPFHSPVLGAVALAIVVGVPATVVARLAWCGEPRTGAAATVAGALLVAWIAVELAFIRELSWLQLFYVLAGGTLVVAGRRRVATEPPIRER